MRVSVRAIWGSDSAPTAEHQRRRPRIASNRAGQNCQFSATTVALCTSTLLFPM
jgi:hypothetical protein